MTKSSKEFAIEITLRVTVLAEADAFPVPEGEVSCYAEIAANSYSDGRYVLSSEILRHGAEQLVRKAIRDAGFSFYTAGRDLRGRELEARNRRVSELQDCHVSTQHTITARLAKEELDDGVEQAFDELDTLKPFFESE